LGDFDFTVDLWIFGNSHLDGEVAGFELNQVELTSALAYKVSEALFA